MTSKWFSRKFIVSVITQVAALVVLMFPNHESEIMQVSQITVSLAVLLLSSLGYVKTEGSIDQVKSEN